ncbi:TonB-linked SusC/RagA family outer membrane protein [Flavobacterium sp. CG_23.5]|uniref:SusC/RagA family TonB-linked outer membrane protein n=1 Tax=Flavobacterium sp. CG_23.5 TaxID=2760708 RepID=UPI001AE2AEDA|nr:SusC/RagA family TonB-linked outer membrane protein [Flavobacterium sp. CG_23.5]MBP2284814.1 TonB-linked SusC/RagA family outer membrane protein [Flavobacterium sp. CG_23.5]
MKNISLNKGRAVFWYLLICILLNTSVALANKPVIPLTMFKEGNSLQKENLKQVQIKQVQIKQITGTVTDNQGQMPGVIVSIKGKNTTVITGFDGKYVIDASPTDTLVFSFMGYKTIEMPVQGNAVINVRLQEDATQLQEVKINAGYYSVKESERTGSIAKISAKDIEKQPVANVLATMQGRMAGVDIVQDSGSPGGSFTIKIRGQNSLRGDGNQPLYIIDGVPYSSEAIGSIATSGTAPSLTSPLNSINPSDIESIEVLKDADATAIYGSRGANGVVLITTKKGKIGKTTFMVNGSTNVGSVTKTPKLMNTPQYLAMRQQAFANDGISTYPDFAYDVNGTWDATRYTDWQKAFIGGTATVNNLQASVSGGNAKTQYLLSGNYRTETTVFPGDFQYNKGAAHFNMNHTSDDDKFKLVFSANYTAQKNNQPATDLTAVSRTLAPNAPELYDADGNLNWANSTWDNPLALLESEFDSRIKDLNANTVLSYQILKNLEAKSSLGYSDLKNTESRTQPHTMYNPAYGLGSEFSGLSVSQTDRSNWIFEPQFNWNTTLGKGKIEALVGSTFQQQKTNRLFMNGFGYSSNSLINDLASASIKTIDLSEETVYKYQAFFVRINYNWNARYIINITGRRDGSSRFGPGKQFATFGAVGAAWIFSNETFLKDNSILSFGKLRTSYGTTGNDQIGDYQFLDTYTSSGNTYQGVIGLQPIRLFNPEFGWETNRKFEAALETGFLKDRLFLTTAYYLNRSSNQLVGLPLPGTTGFSSLNANLDATVQNNGLEFTLRTVNFQCMDFEWTTNFNISVNSNKLVSYPGLESSTNANRYVVGEPINIVKVYNYIGMNPTTGVYDFEDVNGDGVITSLGDRTQIADLSPDFFGGLQNQFTYKNLQLDFLFQFVKQETFGATPGVPGTPVNQLTSVSNPDGQQPFTTGLNGDIINAYYRYALSTGNIEDASYLRLKNISLTYNLPLKMSKGVRCQLYLQGQNLLTFTNYSNGDPEFKFSNLLPPLKVYSAGVKLTL